jgi:dTDP-4-dehydrorhamnose 3,5-epimerase
MSVEKIEGVEIEIVKKYTDERGWLLELWRSDEFYSEMGYVSMTLPGVVRGPHEHREQTDVFTFPGIGEFKIVLWDNREGSPTKGHDLTIFAEENECLRVVVPPGVVHGYMNISEYPGFVFNHPDKLYAGTGKKEPVDEIRHEDVEGSPYELR